MATVSFDVFDTLLTRIWAEPHDLFVALGEQLQAQELVRLPPAAFAGLRRQTEREARNGTISREITLENIYDRMAARIGWDQAQRARALKTELTLELAGFRAVPGRLAEVQAARRHCGRVLFLSDMYLPAAVIQEGLQQSGYYQAGDELLVSGEVGKGKGRGELFQLARDRLRLDYPDWIHHGDNAVADASAPGALGITTRLNQAAHLQKHERTLRGPDRFASAWRSQLAGAARLARLEAGANLTEKQRILWCTGATVAGPLFWGFTRWCVAEAARRGLSDLYFLARGGQIFRRIAGQLRDIPAVACHYLYTSRLAFAGAYDAEDPVRLRQLAAPSLAHHSVRQSLVNLGLDEGALELPPRWPRTRWDENLSRSERTALADWLLAPERLPLVRKALRERSALAQDYLRQSIPVRSDRSIGVVDTGWMGTIQKNMEHLLGDQAGPMPLTGFYLGLSPVREFACSGECLAYTNGFRRLSLRRETTHLILLEIMARGTHGPLLGFSRQDGTVTPRLGPVDAAQLQEAGLFQEAVLAFVRHAESTGVEWPAAAITAPVLIGNYLDFFQHPDAAEVRIIGGVAHADQMLEQRHSTLCHDMTLGEVLRAMADFQARPPGWWLTGQARLGHAPLLHAYVLAKKIKWALQSRLTGRLD